MKGESKHKLPKTGLKRWGHRSHVKGRRLKIRQEWLEAEQERFNRYVEKASE